MKPVFIDIGAHTGEEVAWALDHGYDVYAFEPNPDMVRHLGCYQHDAYICYAAAWDEDGFATLYAGTSSEGASLYKEKTTCTPEHTIVQTVDIGKFLARLNRDIAVLKINAEGAEYVILDSIDKEFGFYRIGKVWVEDHTSKIVSDEWTKHREGMLNYLDMFGVKITAWTPELLEEL